MEQITSAQNPSLKLARKLLKSRRERHRTGKILLDGPHLISGYAEKFGLTGAAILINSAGTESIEIHAITTSLPEDCKLLQIPDRLFREVSPVDTPSGIVALVWHPDVPDAPADSSFWLALDGIQDPGNLGSILRTAAATGVDRVLLSASCTDPWSPKCLRGGMGAQFVLPIVEQVDLQAELTQFEGARIATSSHSGQSLMTTNLSGPVMVLVGGEGKGLNRDLLASANRTICIPLKNGIESLNVGAAVAMVCYEHQRQIQHQIKV